MKFANKLQTKNSYSVNYTWGNEIVIIFRSTSDNLEYLELNMQAIIYLAKSCFINIIVKMFFNSGSAKNYLPRFFYLINLFHHINL